MNGSKIQEKVMPIVNKISNNRYLKATSDGVAGALPVIIVGAIFTLLANFPFEPYQNFLANTGLNTLFNLPITFTTNLLSLYAVFFIGYKMSESFDCSGPIAGMISLLCFFIVTPLANVDGTSFISFEWLGATGFFVAILVGLLVGRIYALIVNKNIVIKMPAGVPPTISQSFTGLIPAFIITPIFLVVAAIFTNTSFGSIHSLVYQFVQTPLQGLGGSFGALLIVILVSHFLWLFGIHGTMVVFSIMMPIWTGLDMANLTAYNAGEPLPNIVGSAFLMTYVLIGGSGATMGMNIYMSFRAKSKRYKTLGALALPGSICGINEPLIFGAPCIMNPKLAIPFILSPIACATIAYMLTVTGIVPKLACIGLPLGTPLVVGGFLQGSWRIAALQVVLVAVSFIIYLPFIKLLDNEAYAMEQQDSEDDVDFSDVVFD
ncbi:PTS transporter subunit EIIC [Clostridium sp. NSJ-145]|uniref:PTS sugar transporter subunit IIC n=1 Tax=Clostridium sp. NSJ-145 TaxID=2897777 RepID=UPI001E484C3E|nr:PTS transporter subunit EIIC [Clostridium sp. NSJ-145]MCD2502154.1 PTS transporter subunit EIIC [Clostridium sp. NSJ-145]